MPWLRRALAPSRWPRSRSGPRRRWMPSEGVGSPGRMQRRPAGVLSRGTRRPRYPADHLRPSPAVGRQPRRPRGRSTGPVASRPPELRGSRSFASGSGWRHVGPSHRKYVGRYRLTRFLFHRRSYQRVPPHKHLGIHTRSHRLCAVHEFVRSEGILLTRGRSTLQASGHGRYWIRNPSPNEVIPTASPWNLGSTECRSDATTAVWFHGGVETSTRPWSPSAPPASWSDPSA